MIIKFEQDGYEIIHQLLNIKQVDRLQREIKNFVNAESHYGIRQLDKKVKAIAKLANSQMMRDRLKTCTPNNLQLVRAIYFNKTPNNNWFVGWHQDKTISVAEKIVTPGFINWTVKQGIIHVQPTLAVMKQIIAVRIHLDLANSNNGALQVIPASHHKILNAEEIRSISTTSQSVICSANPGDVLIMSPLILHRSSKAKFHAGLKSHIMKIRLTGDRD